MIGWLKMVPVVVMITRNLPWRKEYKLRGVNKKNYMYLQSFLVAVVRKFRELRFWISVSLSS